jgi:predicted hydrocarbon binding protein
MTTGGKTAPGPSGVIRQGDLRYVMMRPDTLANIQKGVEDRLGSKSAEYLYTAGASWSLGVLQRMKRALPEDDGELLHLFCEHATQLGWGDWQLEVMQPHEKGLAIRVRNSPIAEAYGQSDQPVCHLLAGAVSGACEFICHMPSACIEQTCAAQGASDCLFVASGHDVAAQDSWDW